MTAPAKRRYAVVYTTTASTVVYVEASSPEEARELADERFDSPSVCAQCAGWGNPSDEAGNSGIELSDEWDQVDADGGVWVS